MNKPRLLLLGARGFLGTYVAQAAANSFGVIRGDRTHTGLPSSVEVDVSNAASVDRAFETCKPDAVMLLAALSNIDRCESQPKEAYAVNVGGAENVANACARNNARLLFTSSAAVFDGNKHGYSEEEPTSPLSVYGKTKAIAEAVVQNLLPSAIVVRVALVLGFVRKTGTNAMLDDLTRTWQLGNSIAFPTYEYRNPIDALTLSEIMIQLLAEQKPGGVYHIGSSETISRYELGLRLAKRTGYSETLVRAQTEALPGRAPRGADHFLFTEKIQKLCAMEMPTCDQVIERCFS